MSLAGTAQCPGNPKAPRASPVAIVLGRRWEALRAAFPLAPSPKVAAEPQRGEGTLCKRAAADERCSLDSSSLLPFPACHFSSKLTSMVFGPLVPTNGPCYFFSLPNSSAHSNARGWGAFVHPEDGSAGLLQPELRW